MSFEQKIQQWVSIDNQLKDLSDKMRELREKRNSLCVHLTNYAKENNLENASVKVSDSRLKFVTSRVQPQLTFKYLEKSLGEIIKNENQVKQIVEYVKQNRESKTVSEIKRYYN
jgi:hypothetical protein